MRTETSTFDLNAWGRLMLMLGSIWIFAAVIGPWGETNIPVFKHIVQTIDARGIDSGAYFYSDIEESYTAQREISGSLGFAMPESTGVTWPFLSGVLLCFLILFIGFRTLPGGESND